MEKKKKPLLIILLLTVCCIAVGQENLIKNSGFDTGIISWGRSHSNYVSHDPNVGRTKPGSLKIDVGDATVKPFASYTIDVERGATYELKAWIRGLSNKNGYGGIKIEWYNVSGRNTSGYNEFIYTKGADDWLEIKITLTADLDSIKARALLRYYNKGPLWFDDVSFVKVADPDPFMVNNRGVPLKPNQEANYKLELVPLKDGIPTELALTLLQDEKEVSSWTATNPSIEKMLDGSMMYIWDVSFPALETGEYQLVLKLPELDSSFESYLDVGVIPSNRQPTNLADNGAYLVNGEPFFPIGLYHVWSEIGYPGHPRPLSEDYQLIVEQGFNAVQTKATTDQKMVKEILDTAYEYGVMADVSLYASGRIKEYLEIYLEMIEKNKEHPAVLTWKIMDEPDLREDNMTWEVPKAYREYKEFDPNTPILLTIAPGDEAKHSFWAHYCDAYQVDPYPLPSKPLNMVANQVALVRQGLEPWQNLTAVLQCGWRPDPSLDNPSNQPNKAQARSMVYLSLINGAKGIFWYSYREKGIWNLPDTPLWEDFPEINAETAWLGEIVTKGEPLEDYRLVEGEVQYACWKYKDKVYVLATNSSNDSAKLKVCMPGGYRFEAQRYDQTSPIFEGRVLLDYLPPVTSTVYILGL